MPREERVRPDLTVSVVVAAYTERRKDVLARAAAAAVAQLRPGDEVVVVVDNNAALAAWARTALPGVRVVESEAAGGLSGARNTGIRRSHGGILVFLDDDAVPEDGWLDALRRRFEAHEVVGVGGAVRADWLAARPAWFPDEFGWVVGCDYRGLPSGGDRIRNPIGANMALRRSALERAGDFAEGLGRVGTLPAGCEETELGIRLARAVPGGVIVRDATAIVHHEVPPARGTVGYFVRRCWHEGRSKAAVATIAGTGDGLSSERGYAARVLPAGVLRELAAPLRGDATGPLRAGAIVAGLFATGAGYLTGRVAQRRAARSADRAGEPAGERPFRPVPVVDVDLDAPIAPQLPAGPVGVVARRAGAPVGHAVFAGAGAGVADTGVAGVGVADAGVVAGAGGADAGVVAAVERWAAGLPGPAPVLRAPLMTASPSAGSATSAPLSEASVSSAFVSSPSASSASASSAFVPEAAASSSSSSASSPSSAGDGLVSVVLCTLGRDPRLRETVDRLLAQTHRDLEVVVVDNDPATGAARALVDGIRDARLRVVDEPCRGLSSARNAGVAAARGGIVAFTDDDALPDADWVETIAGAFAADPDDDVWCVTGLVLPAGYRTSAQLLFERAGGFGKGFALAWWRRTPTPRLVALGPEGAQGPTFPYLGSDFGSGNNMAFRRQALHRIGGFDEALGAGTLARGGEDLDAFRAVYLAGGGILYQPRAIVRHDHREDLAGLREQLYGYGVGMTAVLTKLVLTRPTALAGMVRRLPGSARGLLAPGSEKNGGKGPGYPRALDRAELRGCLAGPVLYLRSRRRARVRRRAGAAPASTVVSAGQGFTPIPVLDVDLDGDLDDGGVARMPSQGRVAVLSRRAGAPVGFDLEPADGGVLPRLRERYPRTPRDAGDAGDGASHEAAAASDAVSAVEAVSAFDAVSASDAVHDGEPGVASGPPTLVSVVIPTLGRHPGLPDAVRAVLAQTHESLDVIVVDNDPAQRGRAAHVLRTIDDERLRLVGEPRRGASSARNAGARVARGEVVAFTDDDTLADPAWIAALLRAFAADAAREVSCVTGLVLPARLDTPEQVLFETYGGFARGFRPQWWRAGGPPRAALGEPGARGLAFPFTGAEFGASNNLAVRADALRRLGGFAPELGAGMPARGGEDLDLVRAAYLAGGAIAYRPDALVWHDHRPDRDALRHQLFGYGAGMTASLTRLAVTRPLLLGGLLARVPAALRLLLRADSAKHAHERAHGDRSGQGPLPRDLARAELRGYAAGPFLYAWSALRTRVWPALRTRPHRSPRP
ncbi:family 2 glycosyl transferase [Microbacterium sp. No. 7]|nr:family 2 glycosyl transferase [Microbacterium sp. No. 7]